MVSLLPRILLRTDFPKGTAAVHGFFEDELHFIPSLNNDVVGIPV